ncbi:TPA: hypothetical protein ACT9A3_000188 [Legionella pneumophila]|nr:hypothetical protein [Legionella pneumophila subsp. pneumophila]HAU0837522.1 hypothetical protein [Legionella pneumophila]HCD9576894.1 hypothetical protein [Legionella pneumophila]HDO7947905.1 hypothetical protein [Legionella pneumophila]HDO7952482.1 hypothetical protein [Legionella pneumophila]
MAFQRSFFSHIEDDWRYYQNIRAKYSDAIPIPQRKYFEPIHSIDSFATLAVRPIEKPLWLGFHTAGFLLKAIIHLVGALVLSPFALIFAVCVPRSELREQTVSSFKSTAAGSIVAAGMACVALLSTLMSLIFNPLYALSRSAATGIDHLNSVTESCCGLTIAKI